MKSSSMEAESVLAHIKAQLNLNANTRTLLPALITMLVANHQTTVATLTMAVNHQTSAMPTTADNRQTMAAMVDNHQPLTT